LRPLVVAFAVLAFAIPQRGLAQQPAATTSLIGIVRDASSGAAVIGALITIDSAGPRGSSDDQGRFSVARVGLGARRITVRRFGYRDLVQDIRVEDPMPGIELRMQPDPIQLAELSTPGQQKADLKGTVRDALTGEVLAWADVSLSGSGGRQVGRERPTEIDGEFTVDDVPTGGYLLKVERIGYVTRYLAIEQRVPSEPLDVTMEPDGEFQRGLAIITGEFDNRLQSSGRTSLRIDEDRLRLAGRVSMRDFFEKNLGTAPVCPQRTVCLYIDEAPMLDSQMIHAYETGDFYRIDVFECMGGASAGGGSRNRITELHAYTYEYIYRTAQKPRIPSPLLC
jgi:hypothetical protein